MNDQDIIDTIADDFNNEIVGNSSDYNGGRLTLGRSRDLAAQALAALRAAGYVIVKLPEPEPGEAAWPIDYPRQNATSWVFVTENSRIGFPPYRVDSSQARQLAAALLAAADAAEEGK